MPLVRKRKHTGLNDASPMQAVANLLRDDPSWAEHSYSLSENYVADRSVHLAVFVEPYLDFILNGKKTVESRFSMVRFPPYGRVARGDVVLLKQSGGPVVGICEIGAAWFYKLNRDSWKNIRREFARALCAEDPEFWQDRKSAEFATLMYVSRARRLPPIKWPKRDRRGWVILRSAAEAPLFGGTMKNTVLAFSGGIASGKSTVSEAIALSVGCPRTSFGGFMRSEAKRRGLPTDDRGILQAIGEELVANDPKGLCKSLLAQSGWVPGGALVIDGVRHVEIANILENLVEPSEFRLIHLSTDESIREERLQTRGETADNLLAFDSHSTEREVKVDLPRRADLLVDGNQAIESIIEEVARWVAGLK